VPGPPDILAGTTVILNGTLSLSAPASVVFIYSGKEAGYRNLFKLDGVTLFDTGIPFESNTPVTLSLDAGTVPFSFDTVSPTGSVPNGGSAAFPPAISLFMLNTRTVYALFNDSFTGDKDFDDIVVRMQIAPIPLPAAGFLLIGGIAGLAALGRTRRRTA
jgi:hypothetical protein